MSEITACPICHTVETVPEFPTACGPARRHPVVRCVLCGLVFQEHLPEPAALEEAQRTAYGRPQKRFAGPVELGIRLFRRARVRRAVALLPENGSVLDVGCGRGLFLRMLQERGYSVRGTELSQTTAANAHPEVPIDVGDLLPESGPDACFDLISIWHVLEHLRAPDRTLAACYQALRPGGALLIAVPNYASIQARLGGELWFHLDLPRHIFHFTPATLRRLLHDQGFETEQLRTGQWEMDPFGLLQTVLNRIGLRFNGLYDTLRNHPEVAADLRLASRVSLLALFPLGMALAVPLSLAFRLAGRAGTLIAVARKPVSPHVPSADVLRP